MLTGVDRTKIQAISIYFDYKVVKGAGSFYLFSKGQKYQRTTIGTTTGIPSTFPNTPKIIVSGGSLSNTIASTITTSNFKVTYNLVGSAAWAGGTILFDDYGTVPIESADLSGRSSLVFKVNGAPKKVKFEIEDASGANRFILSLLQNTSSALTQYFTITSGEITSAGVDMAHIRDINFIVITNLTGSAARRVLSR